LPGWIILILLSTEEFHGSCATLISPWSCVPPGYLEASIPCRARCATFWD
jgi:hypothetical protein